MDNRRISLRPAAELSVKYSKLLIVVGLIVLLFLIGEIFVGSFLSLSQFLLTVKMASFIALFGLCQMIVIAGGEGGLDLSVGYVATLTAVLSARIMDGQNANLWIAVIIAIGIGAFFGLLNGVLCAYVKLPPLVVTMAMANIVQGIINVYTAGASITGKPSPILEIVAAKSTGIIPNIVFLLIFVVAVVVFIMNKTRWGIKLFGAGTNPTAAYLSGVNVRSVRAVTFLISGILSGLIGLLLLGNMGMGFKDMGSAYVMPSIAAVVVGGISLSGGEGKYGSVILGAIFIQTLTNLLIAIGGKDAIKWISFGVVLFVLLIFYARQKRRI